VGLHAPGEAFLVFAQGTDARPQVDAWQRQAERFFATRIELATGGPADGPSPRESTVTVVVAPKGRPAGTRTCHGRPRTDEDLARALDAERRAGPAGLGDLTRRCGYVWLVERDGAADRLALLLAAVLASVVLGPILAPEGALFGVKTARQKLDQ
jgi:hypothetical protein